MMKFGTEYDNFTRARDFWFLDVTLHGFVSLNCIELH